MTLQYEEDDSESFGSDELDRKSQQNYPMCYVDKRHDGDPICKTCAMDIYGVLPRKRFRYPRNCWNCAENESDSSFTDIVDDRSETSLED